MKQEEGMTKGDEKLGYAMVKARLLSDNQLKTAIDYQRSLGGSILDVVVKLGFVRPEARARFLAEMAASPPAAPPPPAAAAEPPPSAQGTDRREKPARGFRDASSRPAALETFPRPDASARARPEAASPDLPGARDALREPSAEEEAPAGGETEPEAAAPAEAPEPAARVPATDGAAGAAAIAAEEPASGAPPSPSSADLILQALIKLLIKKGVFRRKEIEEAIRTETEVPVV